MSIILKASMFCAIGRPRADHHAPTQALFARHHNSLSRRSGRRTCARDCEQGILEVWRCSMMHLAAPLAKRLELLTSTVSKSDADLHPDTSKNTGHKRSNRLSKTYRRN